MLLGGPGKSWQVANKVGWNTRATGLVIYSSMCGVKED